MNNLSCYFCHNKLYITNYEIYNIIRCFHCNPYIIYYNKFSKLIENYDFDFENIWIRGIKTSNSYTLIFSTKIINNFKVKIEYFPLSLENLNYDIKFLHKKVNHIITLL